VHAAAPGACAGPDSRRTSGPPAAAPAGFAGRMIALPC